MSPIFFLHGLHGSGQGIKGRFLKERLPEIHCPELPSNIHQRLALLEEWVREPALLVGSSLGGLSALLFAVRHPERVKGLFLIAPAVGFYDPAVCPQEDRPLLEEAQLPGHVPSVVMAARQDAIIPLSAIEALVHQAPNPQLVRFAVFEDDHAMNQTLEPMWKLLQSWREEIETH